MKGSKWVLVFSIFISSINFTGCKVSDNSNSLSNLLQQKLDSLTKEQIIPGVTLSVRFKNGTNIALASGYADIESKTAMKPDDIMFSGSVGKTYVSAVVLKLYEQNLIDLKSKAIRYINEDWFLNVPNAADITVEMLLNHTAGIPEFVYHKEVWEQLKQNPDKVWSVEERLSLVYKDKPSNAPGEGWAYADSHYIVLGLIIEKVTGKTYYDVLNDLIIKPYNLTNTSPSDIREIKGLVAGYTNLSDVFYLPEKMLNDAKYAFNPQLEWTGGGLVTNVSDLTKWAEQLYGGNVLKPETKTLMFTPTPFKTSLFENAGYGLGCFIGETDSVSYIGHTGFVPGYITFMQYIPKYGIAIAIQFNNDGSHDNFSMKSYFNNIKKAIIKS
jgi:D-alanyl-D-alanine carboxypeptidase